MPASHPARFEDVQLDREHVALAACLAAYRDPAIDRMLGTRTTGPLFMTRSGARMDRKAAGRIIRRIAKEAGVSKRITPNSLRHTHITLSLNAGVTVRDLTNSMGYSDSRQINYYDRDRESLERNATHMISAYVES